VGVKDRARRLQLIPRPHSPKPNPNPLFRWHRVHPHASETASTAAGARGEGGAAHLPESECNNNIMSAKCDLPHNSA